MMKKAIILLISLLLLFLNGCSTPEGPQKDYSESWRDRPMPESFDLRNVDTDGDGKVDIGDATHLQKYLAEFDGIVLGKQAV